MYVGDVCWSALFKANDGGESGIKIEPLTIDKNGTYTAPAGTAYTPVYVNVETEKEEEQASSVVGIAIVGKSVVGSEDTDDVVGSAIVGKSVVGSEGEDTDNDDVVGTAIVGRSNAA